MKKQKGTIANIMISGICILSMTVIMVSYMDNVQLIEQKIKVGQVARKYILQMETKGYLAVQESGLLFAELQEMGVTDINLSGSTVNEVKYGEPIFLKITGKLNGKYDFEENRMSTSKN